MSKGRSVFRTAGLSAATIAMVVAGVALLVSPASARPYDCELTVTQVQMDGNKGMMGRAEVYCARPETYTVRVYIRRKDWYGNTPVAFGDRDRKNYQGRTYAYAYEPCSDLQTNKQYFTHAYLDDTRFGPPIEVKDIKSPRFAGHC